MYCVIQQVMLKKPNRYGAHKTLEAYQWQVNGKPPVWGYRHSEERFERPHREAFKITLHQSYREGGKVKKRQYAICTMSYYDVVEFGLYDCADSRIKSTADKLGLDVGELYKLIEEKLEPLRDKLEAEFHQSVEYKTKQEHERIIAAYLEAQSQFCQAYEVEKVEYDRCYDVFGRGRKKDTILPAGQYTGRNRTAGNPYDRSVSGTGNLGIFTS